MRKGDRIWVTRAQPGADTTAGRLRALGCSPLVASLLVVQPLPPPRDLPQDFTALAFTSANAVRAFAAWTPHRGWPVFAVGAATAQAARLAGFETVSSADGDVAALASRIAAGPSPGAILHPCAREAAGDLAGVLAAAGMRFQALPLYETCAVDRLSSGVADAIERGELDAVLLHSPKAARVLASLLSAQTFDLGELRLLGLSAACLTPVAHLGFASVVAAGEPHEAALLDLLR